MASFKTSISAPGERDIVLSRAFNAPRALVFKAYTRPNMIRQWLGPEGWRVTDCEIDLRAGGAYRFVKRHVSGVETSWRGIYSRVVAPERLDSTFRYFQPQRSDETAATVLFSDEAGDTRLTVFFQFESRDARDRTLASPLQRNMDQSYDALGRLMATMTARDAA
jgi:uncharacterized protein YndB with AHSA1/START domain